MLLVHVVIIEVHSNEIFKQTKPNVTGITFAPNPAVVGKAVTIMCSESESVPEPSYTISHNGKQVSSEKTFTISEVKQSDEGSYTCVAQNNLDSDSATANLTVVVEPNVTLNCSSSITLYEGDDFTCVCRGEGGNPPAYVTWYDRDGVQIGGTGKEEQTLTLSNVDGTDSGTYKCVARSYTHAKSIEVKLRLNLEPNATLSCSSSITVNEGDNFTCVCRGEGGNPPANVTWYKDGVQIGGTGKEEQTLTLSNIDAGKDSGTYKCVARIYTLTNAKSIEVKVRLNLEPNVTLSCSSSVTLYEGDDFTCVCRGEGGNPPANVTWYDRDGVQIGGTGKEEQTLILSNVDGTDSGTYKCLARSYTLTNAKSIEVKVRLNSSKQVNSESSGTVVVWYIVISLVSGIIIGILVSYILWCSCRRWLRNRRPEENPEVQTTEADTTYQELDLSKMNTEDNYRSLGVNAGSNNVAHDDESTYTELSKTRDEENIYQSLT